MVGSHRSMGNGYARFQEKVADATRLGAHVSICFEILKKRTVPDPLLRMVWDVNRNVMVAVKFLQDEEPVRLLDPAEFDQVYGMLISINNAMSGGGDGSAARAAAAYEAKEETECPVCMDAAASVVLPCSHAFCKGCLDGWTSRDGSCPLCRTKVEDEDEHWHLTEGTGFVRYQLQALRALIMSRPVADSAVLPASLAARPRCETAPLPAAPLVLVGPGAQ